MPWIPAPLRRSARARSPMRSSGVERRLPPGAALLGLATLVSAAAGSLVWPTGNVLYCERLAPLGVLAALAATLIALCFRALASAAERRLLVTALLLSALSLFVSARYVAQNFRACGAVQEQLRHLHQTKK